MTRPYLYRIVSQLQADADNHVIDDATFRQRALRLATRLGKTAWLERRDYGAFVDSQTGTPKRVSQAARDERARRAAYRRLHYKFIAVPNGGGGTTSVSIRIDHFEHLSRTLGGAQEVMRLSRELAWGHRPDSGVTRSRYVLMRLLRKAEAVARKSAVTAKQSPSIRRTGAARGKTS